MNYTIYSILIVLIMFAVFYMHFEKKKSRSRRLVIISVMTALSVVGRFIFAAIPAFKPITAIVIITGIWLGAECGFMVGSLSVLISNFYFGQGPWTPIQMLAFGLLGVLAAALSKLLKNNKITLSIFGIFAGIFYSLVMDIWTVLWFSNDFSWQLYLTSVLASTPHLISYAVSNVIFLLLLGKPFGDKLERVIYKYGI